MNQPALASTAGVSTAIRSPLAALAAALGIGLHLWDTTVGVGASVVAGTALTPALIGVGLNTALSQAVATSLAVLVESGVLPEPVGTAVAAMVEGLTTSASIGLAGLGTGIAWKAALDAALANAIAPAGADIINALIGDFPNVDLTAAVSAMIGGLAAMGETALTWWDATITLGASVVAGIAITAATSAAVVAGSVSPEAAAAILGLGSAVAWTAALPAALAHDIATAGLGLVNGIAGLFPNVPNYPVFDLAALQAQLEANFPNFALLPALDLADLNPATFLTVLAQVFPHFPGIELPDLRIPVFDLAGLLAQLEAHFPNFALLPALDLADLNPATFLTVLTKFFPHFPGIELPDLKSLQIDLAALVGHLHSVIFGCNFIDHNFVFSPILHGALPGFDFADLRHLDLRAFVALVHKSISQFPDIHDVFELTPAPLRALLQSNIPGFPDSADIDVFSHLKNWLKANSSVSSVDEEPGMTTEAHVVEDTRADLSIHLRESVGLPKNVLPEVARSPMGELSDLADSPEPALPASPNDQVPQTLKKDLAEEPETGLPSAPKHAVSGEPDERSLVRNASSTPPKHALNDPATHDSQRLAGSDLTGSSTRSPETRSSESSQNSDSSQRGTSTISHSGSVRTAKKQTNDTSDSGSKGASGSSE